MKKSLDGARVCGVDRKNGGVQGRSDPDRALSHAAALCRHLVADDSVYAFLADHRRLLFPDELFADLFPSGRGQPSVPADVIATVMVLRRSRACRIVTRLVRCAPTSPGKSRRSGARRRGDPLLGAHLLAHPSAPVGASGADLRHRPRGRRCHRGVEGQRRRALDSTLLDDAAPPKTPSRSWCRRSVVSAGWSPTPPRSWRRRMTMTPRVSRCARARPRRESGVDQRAGQRHAGGHHRRQWCRADHQQPTRSGCLAWSPAKRRTR